MRFMGLSWIPVLSPNYYIYIDHTELCQQKLDPWSDIQHLPLLKNQYIIIISITLPIFLSKDSVPHLNFLIWDS